MEEIGLLWVAVNDAVGRESGLGGEGMGYDQEIFSQERDFLTQEKGDQEVR